MTGTTRSSAALLLLGLAATLSACGGSEDEADARATPEASAASSPAALPTEPPTTAAEIPDGTYRTRVTKDALSEAGGYDVSSAGTWTLVLRDGTYRLSCSWVDTDGDDCGHTGIPDDTTVEAGPTYGDASTVWLAYDQATTMALNDFGEDNPSNDEAPPYRLTWSLEDSDLVLDDVWVPPTVGWTPSEVNNYTLLPWKRIS